MSAAHDLPFYIVTDQGDVWATHACPGGTSSTFYGKHDAVVQKLSDKIAALERCVREADRMRGIALHPKLWKDYNDARAEIDK